MNRIYKIEHQDFATEKDIYTSAYFTVLAEKHLSKTIKEWESDEWIQKDS